MIAIVLGVTCLLGATANVSLIGVIVAHYSTLGTTPNVFVLQMAMVDALSCCVPYPYAALTLAGLSDTSHMLCSIFGCLLLGHRIASLLSAAMIATNRCVKVTQSTQLYQQIYSQITVRGSVVFMWFMTGLLLLPMVAAGHPGYNQYLGYCLYTHNHTINWMYVNLGLHSCVLTFLFIWTLICYICITVKLRRSHLAVTQGQREAPVSKISVISLQVAPRLSPSAVQISTGPKFLAIPECAIPVRDTGVSRSPRTSEEHRRRVIPCLFIVCTSIIVCWAPLFICSLFPAKVSATVHGGCLCVSCLSTMVNPLLYGAYNRNIRDACKRRQRRVMHAVDNK